MSFLGLSLIAWTAIAAFSGFVGTLALAAAAAWAVISGIHRDDRLRREAADYDAQQVTVDLITGGRPNQAQQPPGAPQEPDYTDSIVVSTPTFYPIKSVEAHLVYNYNGNLNIRDLRHLGEPASTENGRVRWRFWVEIKVDFQEPFLIARFVDRHGTLYYRYREHTRRFPPDTNPQRAAEEIDKWIRTGPEIAP